MALFLLIAVSTYARPADASQSVQPCAAGGWDNELLVAAAGARRGGDSDQNRGVRCFGASGQPMAERVEPRMVRLSETIPPVSPALGFRLQGVPSHDPAGLGAVWGARHPIPDETLGAINRSSPPVSNFAGGAKTRPMACTQKCSALREGRKTCQHVGVTANGIQNPRQAVPARPWGNSFGSKIGPPFYRSRRPGKWVIDLFSGSGGFSRAVRRFGFHAKFWDIRHG